MANHDITVKAVIDIINEGVKNGYITEEDRERLMTTPIYSLHDLRAIELEVVSKIMDGQKADELDLKESA